MKVVEDVEKAARWARSMEAARLSVGLVPTMGALHAGHRSLVEQARRQCDRVAVTIFVNPTQFGPGEDLDAYPRDLDADLQACRELGVDLVLTGKTSGVGAIYAEGFQTWVEVTDLAGPLCGPTRPGHFRGVATVVTLLFSIFRPHRAYFGLKDYQQARLIERMARDLHLGVDVRLEPTVREPDGLAMSSRNRYLSPEDRAAAPGLYRSLVAVEEAFRGGLQSPGDLLEIFHREIAAVPRVEVQYAELRDALTLEDPGETPLGQLPEGGVLAVAAHLGSTRLIDNIWLRPRGTAESSAANP